MAGRVTGSVSLPPPPVANHRITPKPPIPTPKANPPPPPSSSVAPP
ncbi:hypothetical protein WN943_025663 [Citrus x changshan-huyou]